MWTTASIIIVSLLLQLLRLSDGFIPSSSTSSCCCSKSSASNGHDLSLAAAAAAAAAASSQEPGSNVYSIANKVREMTKKAALSDLPSLCLELKDALLQDKIIADAANSKKKSAATTSFPSHDTELLLIGVARDFARLNFDPGSAFWLALTDWLPIAKDLGSAEIASLTLAISTLGVPEGSQGLLDALIEAACHIKTMSRAEALQLRKAITLLQGPGNSFRAGPHPFITWLLAMLQAREAHVDFMSTTTSASGKGGKRETALTSSALHRRVMETLTCLGISCESEVRYAGLNLDIVVLPPIRKREKEEDDDAGLLLPLVIEVDGPQHFIRGDPELPTGDTAARRRLIQSQTDIWAGLIPITWADDGVSGSIIRLVELLEERIRRQLQNEDRASSVALSSYRVGPSAVSTSAWDLSKRLLSSNSVMDIIDIMEQDDAIMDSTHWATALQRLARLFTVAKKKKRIKPPQLRGLGASMEKKKSGKEDDSSSSSLYLQATEKLLQNEGAILWNILTKASFHSLSVILEALADLDCTLDPSIIKMAVDQAAGTSSSKEVTVKSLTSLLTALPKLGYHLSSSDQTSISSLQMLVASATHSGGGAAGFEAKDLSLCLEGLSFLLPPPSSLVPSDDGITMATSIQALVDTAESKISMFHPMDLVAFVQAMSRLNLKPRESFITAIVEAAGKFCRSLTLEDLAVVTLLEPAAGVVMEDNGGGSKGGSERAIMTRGGRGAGGGGEGMTTTMMMSQRGRRKAPQYELVSEVRQRLRALTPSALVKALDALITRGNDDLGLRPSKAFLIMITAELYKQRQELSSREKTLVTNLLKSQINVYDPGQRFWQRFPN